MANETSCAETEHAASAAIHTTAKTERDTIFAGLVEREKTREAEEDTRATVA